MKNLQRPPKRFYIAVIVAVSITTLFFLPLATYLIIEIAEHYETKQSVTLEE